eukprot:scaffold26490_cov36-Phaeocystis_antarctica.AAC.1
MQAAQYTHLSALVFALAHRSIGPWIAARCKQRLGIANRLRCLWDRLEAGNVPLLCFSCANRLPAGTRLVLLPRTTPRGKSLLLRFVGCAPIAALSSSSFSLPAAPPVAAMARACFRTAGCCCGR